jgi:polysaccharide export outer membrane protein
MVFMSGRSVLVVVAALLCWPPVAAGQVDDYEIGPSDLLRIVVLGQTELSGEFSVEPDGLMNFPLLGKVKAAGMTASDLQKKLIQLLSDGYFKRPQVSVLVKEYRSQRVFVTGEVDRAGPYALKSDRSLFALLSDLGNLNADASREVIVTRPARKPGPPRLAEVLPENVISRSDPAPELVPTPEVIRVSLRDLQAGGSEKNIILRSGDTVTIPRAAQVYVQGHVARPGPYRYVEGTSILQLLNQAGGVTERGAEGRAKIVRIVDGKKEETKAQLTDLVQPEDMVVVPERFF